MLQEIFVYEASVCNFDDDSCERFVIYFQESYKQIIVFWSFLYSCLVYDLYYFIDIDILVQFESLLFLFPFEVLVCNIKQVCIEARKEPFYQECCFFGLGVYYKGVVFDTV